MPARDHSSESPGLACRPRLVCTFLIAITLVVYGQVGWHQFIEFYDDGVYVVENEHIVTGLTRENIVWAFSPGSTKLTGNWHPLTWLSLMTDASLFGPGPAGFHVTNMLIHMANGLVLFGLLYEATRACWRSAFVAAVFAVHPLHVESVAWIAERKDVLSTFWGLIAIWSYVRWVKRAQPVHYWLSLLAFVLSLLSKLMFVTLPFLLLVLDAWPLGRMRPAEVTSSTKNVPTRSQVLVKLVVEKLPYLVLTVIACFIAYYGQQYGEAVKSLDEFPLGTRILNAIVVYVLYLWMTIYPIGLAVFYPYPDFDLTVQAIAAGGLLLLLTALAVWQRRARPYLLAGWLWYLGTLVPVIGLVQISIQRMADRYMYFPMVGLLVALTWLIPAPTVNGHHRQWPLRAGVAIVIGLLTILATIQTAHWRDDAPLFTHAIAVEESRLAHFLLACEYAKQHRFHEAIEHHRNALRLDPRSVNTHKELAHLYLVLGDTRKARLHFEKVLAFAPQHIDSHYRLGVLAMREGEPEQALEYFRTVLESYPDDEVTHVWIGTAYAEMDQYESAIEHFRQALATDSDLVAARVALGDVLAKANLPSQAIEQFERVLVNDPTRSSTHLRLALLYEQQGDVDQARRHVAAVLAIQPDDPNAQEILERLQQ